MRCARIPLCFALALAAVQPTPVMASPALAESAGAGAIALAIRDQAHGAFKHFYADRGFRPLWTAADRIGPQADTLIGFLKTAESDGLKPSSYDIDDLDEAVEKARGGDPRAIARAELDLSAAFTRYVQDQRRRPGDVRMIYADAKLKPRKLAAERIMRAAAFPKSFAAYVAGMGWMGEEYVRLRGLMARADGDGASRETIARLRLNLDRARLLPGPWTRHVVVDASSGRLSYYEAGERVGTMRVVVGAKATQTPMLVGSLQWAIVNPYWNVPDYLVRQSIAVKVLGGRSLASMRIEALSDWSATPQVIPASRIDWNAVASGERDLRLRELPGASNSMGRVKFLFPNDEGIYLHDTPDRDLLKKPDRHLSNGCIRLENAGALGRWLLGKPVGTSKQAEQAVALPAQVPVYLTYITAADTAAGITFRDDVYGRDQ